MHRKTLLVAVVGLLVLATLIIVAQRVTPSTASEQCAVDQLKILSSEERERCMVDVYGGKEGFISTVEAADVATRRALPSEAFPTDFWPTPTLTPIGYVPPFVNQIGPVSTEGQDWRGSESVWIVGGVQDTNGEYAAFFVWTNEAGCRLGTEVDTSLSEARGASFPADIPINEYWDCPSDGSILSITNVTSPTGIVSFSTDQGQTGTFDLATAAWTLDGVPWVAPAPARAADPYPNPDPYPYLSP